MLPSILVWILVVSSGLSGTASQLGPFADEESCKHVRKNLQAYVASTCVQVNVPK